MPNELNTTWIDVDDADIGEISLWPHGDGVWGLRVRAKSSGNRSTWLIVSATELQELQEAITKTGVANGT